MYIYIRGYIGSTVQCMLMWATMHVKNLLLKKSPYLCIVCCPEKLQNQYSMCRPHVYAPKHHRTFCSNNQLLIPPTHTHIHLWLKKGKTKHYLYTTRQRRPFGISTRESRELCECHTHDLNNVIPSFSSKACCSTCFAALGNSNNRINIYISKLCPSGKHMGCRLAFSKVRRRSRP